MKTTVCERWRQWIFVSVYLIYLIVCHSLHVCVTAEIPTYRIVHLEDLYDDPFWQLTHKQWTTSDFGVISRVALHMESNSLFVAVNNSVLRLSADTLEKLDEVSWSLPREHSEACRKYPNNLVNCNAYMISLLVPADGIFPAVTSSLFRTGLFTCISNGKASECSLRQASDLRGPPKVHWKGSMQCPTDPRTRVAATFASNRYLYVASNFDEVGALTPTIVRISEKSVDGNSPNAIQFARTASKPNWIFQDERTTFIHSFEFHNAIYFLFREPAEEVLSGCKKNMVVSRVGRICLNEDVGRNGLLQTFFKATIVCPGKNEDRAGSSAFVHTLLQSVHVDQSTKTLFAAFTTPSTMPASSVLCEYRLTELEKTFEGPFYTFNGEHTKFNNPVTCQKSGSETSADTNIQLDSRLMYNVIRPRTDQPIMMKEGTLWMHLSVDWVPQTPKSDNNLIVFTMDSEDVLTKWHLFKSEACIIERLHMRHDQIGLNRGQTIRMQLIRDQAKPTLLIATRSSVYRMPVSRCARLGHNEQTCTLMHDPYCAWNGQTHQCQDLTDVTANSKQLNKYETCPAARHQVALDVTVDGAWGAWGPWSSCRMTNNRSLYARWLRESTAVLTVHKMEMADPLIVNNCQCRHRYCSAPYRFGTDARACSGDSAVQLANCSIDGMWTAWSSWSGCEPACAAKQSAFGEMRNLANGNDPVSLRTRQRWCTNPNAHGKLGKKCLGPGKESHVCPKPKLFCPDEKLPVPQWSQWSAWSACSSACNGGVQLRWRKCGLTGQIEQLQPAALKLDMSNELFEQQMLEHERKACLGEAYESRGCNMQSCPITKVTSTWTAWYVTEGNRQRGTRERRYRVECVATVPEVDKLQASIQLENGNCRTDAAGKITCQDLNPEDKTKMENDLWSTESERGWSEWASCSRPCGGGTRNRWRLKGVLSSTGQSHYISPSGDGTPEVEKEAEECNTHPCPGLWSCWTAWSKCTHPPCSIQRGEQRRYRSCLISSNVQLDDGQQPTVDQCDGGEEQSVQSRPCEVTFEDLQCYPNSGMDKYDLTKRTIPSAREDQTSLGKNLNSPTAWAEWSECIPVDGLAYEIQVRAREHCDRCELAQAKRCDTQETVPISEILKSAPHLREGISSSETKDGQAAYGIWHAVIVGLCGALLGVAIVLVPYLVHVNRTRKQAEKRNQMQRASVWRKLTERKLNSNRNLPYIWFADTDRSASEKAALKQMLLQRKHGTSPVDQPPVERHKTRSVARLDENVAHSPNTLHAQASVARSMPYPNASLTRIQALHNDHRNPVMPKSTSPLSLHEPVSSWDTSVANKTGLNPVFVDSSPPQHHVEQTTFSPSSHCDYQPVVNNTDTCNLNGAPVQHSRLQINDPVSQDDDIIYASATCP